MLESVAKRAKALKVPSHQRRTMLTAEIKPTGGKERWFIVDVHKIWLAGIGDDTFEYKRRKVDSTMVPEEDIYADRIKLSVGNDASRNGALDEVSDDG